MRLLDDAYEWVEDESAHSLQFVFISKGEADVVKAVQYSLLAGRVMDKEVYNLGFGDYDIRNDSIIDSVNSNNGDVYKVFHTVLNTIPAFFAKHPFGIIMVQGSDSSPEFVEGCRQTCRKRCENECKNLNRRISTYRAYVNRSYDQLSVEFDFMGGLHISKSIIVEPYQVGKKYDAVLVFRKMPITSANES